MPDDPTAILYDQSLTTMLNTLAELTRLRERIEDEHDRLQAASAEPADNVRHLVPRRPGP